MRLALTTFLAFALTGCVAIQDLTNPLAAQGVILGVELPEDPELAAIAQLTGLVDQTIATVFLADGIQQRPITGAQISTAPHVRAANRPAGAPTAPAPT